VDYSSFNPVLGFLPVATPETLIGLLSSSPFQSRAGFSARRDAVSVPVAPIIESFQSRAGFSARRDHFPPIVPTHDSQSFNPVLGFLPVATEPRAGRDRRL